MEADTFGDLRKADATAGGLLVQGFRSSAGAAGQALHMIGQLGEAADTTDTSASIGVITSSAYVTNGTTGNAAVAAGGNAHAFCNASTAIFLLKGNGDAHITNTTLAALDSEDDLALIRAYQKATSGGIGMVMSRWDDILQASADDLKRVGVLSSKGDFIVQQRFNSLVGGSLWKLYTLYQDTCARLAQVEQALNALPAA